MRHLAYRWTQTEYFFLKSGTLFSNFLSFRTPPLYARLYIISLILTFGIVKIRVQGSTINIKWPYEITYVCQNFGVRDVRGQIPKGIYQA